jgi:predicted nucleotidyltransferase
MFKKDKVLLYRIVRYSKCYLSGGVQVILNQEELENLLQQNKKTIQQQFYVKKIGYFGSFARNQQTNQSDVDILVEFAQPVGWEFFNLKYYLEDLLKIPVDLVTPDALKPQIREHILKEVRYQ